MVTSFGLYWFFAVFFFVAALVCLLIGLADIRDRVGKPLSKFGEAGLFLLAGLWFCPATHSTFISILKFIFPDVG